jgi:thymidylate synthase ThyX
MKTFIYDEFNPQDVAMMQALYSRSAASVTEHVEKVKVSGSGKFMERFYVGYGHASIADCGSTTVFIEGVSMLAAKAIQDWPLYSGQETSSRYIDMSKQEIKDPLNTKISKQILKDWMDFYISEQENVRVHLHEKFPRKEGEDEKVYEKAINARIFDILRGFLPAGVTTQLSWHTNLRQAHDKLALLKHHPLAEIKEIAESIHKQLLEKYPQSFGHQLFPEQEAYRALSSKKYSYFGGPSSTSGQARSFSLTTTIKPAELSKYKDVVAKRPIKTSLPLFLSDLGTLTFKFPLDFGSFRDIQRHRNGVCRMPMLTTAFGFEEWYLGELPKASLARAKALIIKQKKAIASLKAPKEVLQYYIAMGFKVPCVVTYALPAALYTMELRSGRLVHPTLRKVALQMCAVTKKKFPLLALHPDLSKDDWDIRRGLQDIKERK